MLRVLNAVQRFRLRRRRPRRDLLWPDRVRLDDAQIADFRQGISEDAFGRIVIGQEVIDGSERVRRRLKGINLATKFQTLGAFLVQDFLKVFHANPTGY